MTCEADPPSQMLLRAGWGVNHQKHILPLSLSILLQSINTQRNNHCNDNSKNHTIFYKCDFKSIFFSKFQILHLGQHVSIYRPNTFPNFLNSQKAFSIWNELVQSMNTFFLESVREAATQTRISRHTHATS